MNFIPRAKIKVKRSVVVVVVIADRRLGQEQLRLGFGPAGSLPFGLGQIVDSWRKVGLRHIDFRRHWFGFGFSFGFGCLVFLRRWRFTRWEGRDVRKKEL